jgi:hypothetical protein
MNDANYNRRVDLDPSTSAPGGNSDVNLLDLLKFKPHFNQTCNPVTSVSYIKIVDGTVVAEFGDCNWAEFPPGTWTCTVVDGCTEGGRLGLWIGLLENAGADAVQGETWCVGDPPNAGVGPLIVPVGNAFVLPRIIWAAADKGGGDWICEIVFTNGAPAIPFLGIGICIDP